MPLDGSMIKTTNIGNYIPVRPNKKLTYLSITCYCDESAFRYNNKKACQDERFAIALNNCEGTLQYKALIAE